MHYVKQFHINGVDTKQVACIELHGVPNAATEGAVGVLGMDITSPTHDVYKCVAVNGSVYTWELLSAGMSIMSATETGEGALSKVFPYTSLRCHDGYLIKRGDLILDSEGYLYRVIAIDAESCSTEYCGTHIGGIASGDKDYTLSVVDGKLQLVTESGNVVGEIDTLLADEETIYRNPISGRACVMGIHTVNGTVLRFFVGKQADYEELTDEQKEDLFAIITDDTTKEEILEQISKIISGATTVGKAVSATVADRATVAESTDFSKQDVTSIIIRGTGAVTLDRSTAYLASFGDGSIMILAVGDVYSWHMRCSCFKCRYDSFIMIIRICCDLRIPNNFFREYCFSINYSRYFTVTSTCVETNTTSV